MDMPEKLLLERTIFSSAYSAFRVGSDVDLVYRIGYFFVIYTAIIGFYSVFFPSPYGKFSASWTGPTVNAKFAWMIQELPAFLVPCILLLQSPCIYSGSWTNKILITLFVLHYLQRSLVYPLRIKRIAKPVPVSAMIMALLFCGLNGFFQAHHLLNIEKISGSIFFTIGVVLFVTGMAINIYHDGILIKLKNARDSSGGRSGYGVPRGGFFEYISGANYFGEIVEWWGLALASGKIPQLIFAVFSSLFLGTRAWHSHQYYKSTFRASYPAHRTAIIPFIL